MQKDISDVIVDQIKNLAKYKQEEITVFYLSHDDGESFEDKAILNGVDGLKGLKLLPLNHNPYYLSFIGDSYSISKIFDSKNKVIYDNPIINYDNLKKMNKLSLEVLSFGEHVCEVSQHDPDLHLWNVPGIYLNF